MSQISPAEASDLLQKLFVERKRLATFLITSSGTRVRLDGFLTGTSSETGLFFTTRPLPDGGGDWINVSPFLGGLCIFSYGETREIDEEMRDAVATDLGESALTILFRDTNERLAIFFTL